MRYERGGKLEVDPETGNASLSNEHDISRRILQAALVLCAWQAVREIRALNERMEKR